MNVVMRAATSRASMPDFFSAQAVERDAAGAGDWRTGASRRGRRA